MNLEKEIEELIKKAISEDIGSGDVTSLACLPDTRLATATFFLKQAGVIAGQPLLQHLFSKLDPRIDISLLAEEGSFQKAGVPIAKVSGSAAAILAGEGVALKILQHASGVASITAAYVKRLSGTRCDILDTRRTLPGLRALEKYAVAVGGGKNHRNSLSDCFLIKPSHLAFLAGSEKHPIAEAVEKVRTFSRDMPIEVQIDDMSYIEEVLKYDVRTILFRNLSKEELANCVTFIRKANKKAYLAFSGSMITLENIREFAETGINGISVVALTHSVQDLDIGMRIK